MGNGALYEIHKVIFNKPKGLLQITECILVHKSMSVDIMFYVVALFLDFLTHNWRRSGFKFKAMDSDSESEFQPPKKKLKTSVMNRFQIVLDEKMAVMSKWYVTDSTKKNTDWVLKVFDLVHKARQ